MSALTWLFGLGALAVVFPLLFHLIRRTPKGNQPFGSLMFLRPSPPRLTKRSRLENLLLLALRMGALALIALAFMRPFFRNNVDLGMADAAGRKIAVLLDTSASMRRGDLWTQAIERVKKITGEATARDDVAVYAFDSQLTCHVPFGLKSSINSAETAGPVSLRLEELEPSWHRSNLGSALATLADEIDQQSDEADDPAKLQIIVISDMQSGSSTSALQSYAWPENVMLDVQRVELKKSKSNATLELLQADAAEPSDLRELVHVSNAKDSLTDQFTVSWATEKPGTEREVPFYVPAGSSKILRVARNEDSLKSNRLILKGDDAEFDNQFHVVPPNQQLLSIAYLGNEDRDDPDQMLYYFERCLFETPIRKVDILQYSSGDAQPPQSPADESPKQSAFTYLASDKPDLLVVTRPVTDAEQKSIDSYLADDGSVLIVLANEDLLASTQTWTGVDPDSRLTKPTTSGSSYAMIGEIDFEHPVFQPFAGPRLNDFTQIRFWQHLETKFQSDDAVNVIARFDDDSPAMWQTPSEKAVEENVNAHPGTVLTLATGWQPQISQLALSSKFLPIVNRMVDLAVTTPQVKDALLVGDTIELPAAYQRATVRCDSRSFKLDPDTPATEQTNQFTQPGVYQLSVDDGPSDSSTDPVSIAINVDPAESSTAIMPLEQLTAYGVNVGKQLDAAADAARQRKLQDQELENRQRLWKWLIIGAIALLIAETWLAGRTDRQSRATEFATE